MDTVPAHAINSPFGTSTPERVKKTELFNRYRDNIVSTYQNLYDKVIGTKGFDCPYCHAYIGHTKCTKILAHLASLKCIRSRLPEELLHEDDRKSQHRRIRSKHTIDASGSIVNHVIG